LLVSVRSADEARAAVAGGADVIDVKEPRRGPLGRADAAVWSEVRAAVPEEIPLSVALGELTEWGKCDAHAETPDFRGLAFRKLGLAGAGTGWEAEWTRLRRQWTGGPKWVAVVYADWERADAPEPDRVLDAALAADDCAGVLFDTWDKTSSSPVDLSWWRWFERARRGGRFTALAGRVDSEAIGRLAALGPDVIAVRGAACFGNDRGGTVDADRVAALARAAAAV